jgi:hypothetical protein
MRKQFFVAAIFILALVHASAQTKNSMDSLKTSTLITSSGPRFVTSTPLYIISTDNRKLHLPASDSFSDWSEATRTIKQIDASWINSVRVLKDSVITENYGYDGRHGVVLIDLKDGSLKKLPAELRQKFN